MADLKTLTAAEIVLHSEKTLDRWAAVGAGRARPPLREQSHRAFPPAVTRGAVAIAKLLRRCGLDLAALRLLNFVRPPENDAEGISWQAAKILLRLERTASLPWEQRSYREAGLTALAAASRSPDSTVRLQASLLLADQLYRAGRYLEAEDAAETALSVDPANAKGLQAKARSALARGLEPQASALYRNRAETNPEVAEPGAKVLERLDRELIEGDEQPHSPEAPLLVGIGGGIGDILHATPALRNIASRTGEPIEVLLMSDHPGAEALVTNNAIVSRVHLMSREVLERQFQTVLLLHSFGPARFAFRSDRVLASRDWFDFRPGLLQETIFNLEAVKTLLGIPYDAADQEGYFVGAVSRATPSQLLVGMHAGSKGGRWLSKRWPGFEELASRLAAKGVRVASYGMAEEYIPGTEDRTGGTIDRMCLSMAECSHFVSNDSGPMHIANALGVSTLAVFAPTDAMTHAPLGATTRALQLQKRCSPCEVKNHKYFASGACRCVGEITIDQVEDVLSQMMQDHPISRWT